MKRTAVTPGGPVVSAAKKQRLAALESSLGAGGAPPPTPTGSGGAAGSRPPQQKPHKALATQAPKPPAALSPSGPSRQQPEAGPPPAVVEPPPPEPGAFPYVRLNDNIMAGPVGRMMQAGPGPSSALVALLGARSGGSGSRGTAGKQKQQQQQNQSDRAAGQLGPMESLIAELMGTSPRCSIQELRSVLAARAQDKTVMLDNPVTQSAAGKAAQRQRQRAAGAAPRPPPRNARRSLADFGSRPGGAPSFADLLPLHDAWCKYMSQLLEAAPDDAARGKLLLQADMHGAALRVASSSSSPRHVGLGGRVAKVTANTFVIVSEDDRVHVLPKRGCVFEVPLHACDILVTMHGSKLLDLQAAAATAQRQRG